MLLIYRLDLSNSVLLAHSPGKKCSPSIWASSYGQKGHGKFSLPLWLWNLITKKSEKIKNIYFKFHSVIISFEFGSFQLILDRNISTYILWRLLDVASCCAIMQTDSLLHNSWSLGSPKAHKIFSCFFSLFIRFLPQTKF